MVAMVTVLATTVSLTKSGTLSVPRARVYLTLSPKDAGMLADILTEAGASDSTWLEDLGHKDAHLRIEKMQERLVVLIDHHTPSLAEDAFGPEPDDYAG